MPSINLRLSEQQHADLERWATDGHRSLQKEIIFRLFADQGVLDVVREHVVKEVEGQLHEGATITGEHRIASGGTGATAPADSVQASGSVSGSQGSPGHTPFSLDDDALRPPRSSCPMSPPRGTKCKVCGKVHPL